MARTFTARELAVQFARWPATERKAVASQLNREMGLLVGFIRGTYFRRGGRRSVNHIVSRTGRLEASVKTLRTSVRFGKISAGVRMGGPSAPYAPFLEFGTRGPYIIVPRRGKRLRFQLDDGTVVFARRVVHPGIRARAPLGRGVARRQAGIVKRLHTRFSDDLQRRFS